MPSGFRCVLDVRAKLGECPTWSARDKALYWVDIDGPSLNRFDPATGENRVTPMPESIGSFALRKPAGFIVALRSGIWLARADGSLDRRILAQHAVARDSITAIPLDFAAALTEDRSVVQSARDEIDALRRLIKLDVASLLGITLSLSDNDGD